MCLSCEDIARQICAIVHRRRFLATFCDLYFQRAACSTFQTCILISKSTLGPHHVWKYGDLVDIQSPTAEIRRGKKERRRKKKPQDHNESKHSEMGPVRQNPIQRTVRSVHMCVHCTMHNCCAQYCTEQT